MPFTRSRFVLAAAVAACAAIAWRAAAAPTPSPAPIKPVLFAPEADWPAGSDIAPAFTHDVRTVFFTHAEGATRFVMVSHLVHGRWSTPVVAPFSGTWRDIEPAMAPDGSYMVFISNRPAAPGGQPLDGYFGGKVQPGKGGNIWRVDRTRTGWSEPRRLPDVINSGGAIYSPAVAGDGSIYFNQPDPVTKKSHVYRAQARKDGGFDTPVSQSISDGTMPGFDVAIRADESFIVFSAPRAPAPPQSAILFIAYKAADGGWTTPQPLMPITQALEARFSPDMRTLYFSMAPPGGSAEAPSRIYQTPFKPR